MTLTMDTVLKPKFAFTSEANLWQLLARRRAMLSHIRGGEWRASETTLAQSIMEIEDELRRRGAI